MSSERNDFYRVTGFAVELMSARQNLQVSRPWLFLSYTRAINRCRNTLRDVFITTRGAYNIAFGGETSLNKDALYTLHVFGHSKRCIHQLLKLQQVAHLRLIVPVPETYTGSVVKGMPAVFHVPERPGRRYTAKVARIPNALDQQSRSMMVELDVFNKDGSLAPGMYPTVDWPVSAGENLLFVPATSVVTTMERTFVIALVNGRAHWIDVRKGPSAGENVSIRRPNRRRPSHRQASFR